MKRPLILCLLAALMAAGLLAHGATALLTVDVNRPGHPISPWLWGIFFEDINCSADGGIYPERVRNRSFEDSAQQPVHWSLSTTGGARAEMRIDTEHPLNPYNAHSLRLSITRADGGAVNLVNNGYWGMNIVKGADYRFSLAARSDDGFKGPLTVLVQNQARQPLAQGAIDGFGPRWRTFSLDLKAAGSDPRARLILSAGHTGTLWLDLVSLMPRATWKDHGLRPDLASMLANLHPSFVRFPGGSWVDGNDLAHAYRWKATIGDVAERRPLYNLWGYHTTQGLGFHEYLQMCEDLRAAPLFVINCGMSGTQVVPLDQMGQWVQDALDAIQYANGPADTLWGGLRARNGHAAPFHLRLMEIGNENGGPAYDARYPLFYRAIKARYPGMRLVADQWGGVPRGAPVEIVDEHYYSSPEFFLEQAGRYDHYDRRGPRIYVGEYAVTQGAGQGNLRAAVAEAAFMTGIERNSDVVIMASYAPLFANVHHKAWNPDLIDFDSSRVYGIPSYYVQQMFGENRGDVVLPVTLDQPPAAVPRPSGKIGLGTWLTQAEYRDVRVTRGNQVLYASHFNRDAAGWTPVHGDWRLAAGAYRQTATTDNAQSHCGNAGWTDYTLRLRARKLGGAEGFLIMFHVRDDRNWTWWNIGGWGNREDGIELSRRGTKTTLGRHVPEHIETGRWYDIRIELKGLNIKCYLDGKRVHDVDYPVLKPLYCSASRQETTGEVILKVVNAANHAEPVAIRLDGATRLRRAVRAIVLTAADASAENSLDVPTRVALAARTFAVVAPSFRHTFPPNSVTVLRLQPE